MIVGFNENVLHSGKMYHIQTEDAEPKIVTHIFHGGNIVATVSVSYSDIIGSEHAEKVVKEIMVEQHKTMLQNLKNGMFDKAKEVVIEKKEDDGDKSLDEVILDFLAASLEHEDE